ncbi:hybrid sensor histidine kinase/response regulator [Mesoterricola silvestris]|uniref:histidine kinase n=1 Tax=Mesoterricola silvestris TaxID=2927979 RepID=A0AA48GSB7_9BACT|nr:ATP-binding protein [Mesoterricola silvestris]BDU70846.1 hybrid sensor histidine kinase/response regulator [Mesoterricola silvestris]
MAERAEGGRTQGAPPLFLAELSHEIRNPLNVILSLCHLAARTPPLSTQQRGYLDQILGAAHTLLQLVEDNLDLSKLEAGALTVVREPLDLGALCQELVHRVRRRADEKGIFFRIQWGAGVPRHLLGDADRLKQVLVNLVDNAIKFTPKGEVRLFVDPGSAGTEFRVRDTGPGLDAHQRSALFKPFSRPLPQGDGSGLGLSLARRLVGLMGGELQVDSHPGEGSTFRFTLPAPAAEGPDVLLSSAVVVEGDSAIGQSFAASLRPFVRDVAVLRTLAEAETHLALAAPPDLLLLPHGAPRIQRRFGLPTRCLVYRVRPASVRRAQKAVDLGWIHDFLLVPTDSARILDLLQAATPDPQEPSPAPFREHPRVLLVEDNEVNRMVTRELLERVGLRVAEATGGLEALRAVLAPGEPPACILMDLELPGMGGLEATRRIRALHGPHIPILALTANLLQDERHQCMLAGMDGFLAKPVDPDLLYRTLERHLPSVFRPQAPPQPPSAPPPSIQWRFLLERLQGNRDLLNRVLSQFRREAASFRRSMHEAMERGDVAAMAALAHTLAGAAGNIGADSVSQASRRLQRSPSGTNLAILEQALERLETELAASDLSARPAEPGSPPPTPEELPLIRDLLERNSLDALGHLPRLREAFRIGGLDRELGELEEAVEGLDFPRALALLDTLSEPRRNPCPGGPRS